jgi:hypothetical protein
MDTACHAAVGGPSFDVVQALLREVRSSLGVNLRLEGTSSTSTKLKFASATLRQLRRDIGDDAVEAKVDDIIAPGIVGRDTYKFEHQADPLKWSRDAPALLKLLETSNPMDRAAPVSNFDAFRKMLSHISLNDQRISTLGMELQAFAQIEELSICCNNIDCLDLGHLPFAISCLHAMANRTVDIKPPCRPLNYLKHVGLSFNELLTIPTVSSWAPNLMSIDLSANNISDLNSIIARLMPASAKLRHLSLTGNPCSLVRGYGKKLLSAFPMLESLDKATLHVDARETLARGTASESGNVAFAIEIGGVSDLSTPQAIFLLCGLQSDGSAPLPTDKPGKKGKPATKSKLEVDTDHPIDFGVHSTNLYRISVSLLNCFHASSSDKSFLTRPVSPAASVVSSASNTRPPSAKVPPKQPIAAKGASAKAKDDKKELGGPVDFATVLWEEVHSFECAPSVAVRDAMRAGCAVIRLVELVPAASENTEREVASLSVPVSALLSFGVADKTTMEIKSGILVRNLTSVAEEAVDRAIASCTAYHSQKEAEEAGALPDAATKKGATSGVASLTEPRKIKPDDRAKLVAEAIAASSPTIQLTISRLLR